MESAYVNGSVHTARKQHQRVCIRICAHASGVDGALVQKNPYLSSQQSHSLFQLLNPGLSASENSRQGRAQQQCSKQEPLSATHLGSLKKNRKKPLCSSSLKTAEFSFHQKPISKTFLAWRGNVDLDLVPQCSDQGRGIFTLKRPQPINLHPRWTTLKLVWWKSLVSLVSCTVFLFASRRKTYLLACFRVCGWVVPTLPTSIWGIPVKQWRKVFCNISQRPNHQWSLRCKSDTGKKLRSDQSEL